jgi:DNA-binding PadR family transcriptional regulator
MREGAVMGKKNELAKHLPLTEPTYYIMLALTRPLHGYAVMQRVEELSRGTVRVGPGTLYGAFVTLEQAKLIHKVGEEGRRKVHALTPLGNRVLEAHGERLRTMARAGTQARSRR